MESIRQKEVGEAARDSSGVVCCVGDEWCVGRLKAGLRDEVLRVQHMASIFVPWIGQGIGGWLEVRGLTW